MCSISSSPDVVSTPEKKKDTRASCETSLNDLERELLLFEPFPQLLALQNRSRQAYCKRAELLLQIAKPWLSTPELRKPWLAPFMTKECLAAANLPPPSPHGKLATPVTRESMTAFRKRLLQYDYHHGTHLFDAWDNVKQGWVDEATLFHRNLTTLKTAADNVLEMFRAIDTLHEQGF
jgi:hypothetical protein